MEDGENCGRLVGEISPIFNNNIKLVVQLQNLELYTTLVQLHVY